MQKLLLLLLMVVTIHAAQRQNISQYQLDNGLEILLIQNPALPMIGVNVIVGVGSAYEDFSTSGACHLLEHMLFNGTETRTQKALYDDIDRIGAYNNAQTGAYFTNFMMVTPAEHIRQGMEIQADMLFKSTIPEANFLKEKGIVLEEVSKSLSESNAQLEQNLNSLLYKGHALSLPTLGTYATIKALTRDDVHRFYKNFYVPNNMRVLAVGPFDFSEMRQMIQEIYGQAKPDNIALPKTDNWSIAYDRINLSPFAAGKSFIRSYDGQDEILQLVWPLPENLQSVALQFLDDRLSELATDYQMQASSKEMAVEMGTLSSPAANFLLLSLRFPKGIPDIEAMRRSVADFLKQADLSVSESELPAKANARRTFFLQNLEKPHMLGIYNAPLIATEGIDAFLQTFEKNEIIRQARQLKKLQINGPPMTIIHLPFEKQAQNEGAIQVKTEIFTAKDGLPTLIVRQNSASDLIAIHYLIGHKAHWQSKYGENAALILHDCIGQRLENTDNQKVTETFGLSITVNDNPYIPMDDIYLHPDFGYLRIEGINDDKEKLIGFLNQALLNFIPTQAEFEKALTKVKGQKMSRPSDPAREKFKSLVNKIVYQPEALAAGPADLSYKQLIAFAKNYFQPANMIISIVSSAMPETIFPLFAEFKGDAAKNELPVLEKAIQLHSKAQQIHENVNSARAYLFWGYAREIAPAEKAPLVALSLLLRDTISFQIREKMGMAYSIDAGIEIAGERALFYISQGSRSENVETLRKIYPDFFKAALFKKTTEADLEKAINMYLGRSQFRRLSSINQAFYLGHSYYFHRDIHADEAFLNELKEVKLADLMKVARKYLKVKNPIEIIVQ